MPQSGVMLKLDRSGGVAVFCGESEIGQGSDSVLAYVVAPGIVRTRMSEISATFRGGPDAVNAALAMGEMVEPKEVAELIAFLAGGSMRHLSGATLDVNGASYIR